MFSLASIKKRYLFIFTLITISIFIAVKGNNIREIQSEIIINKNQEIVWKQITNFEDWKLWHPFASVKSGKSTTNTTLKIVLKGDSPNSETIISALILEATAPKKFYIRTKKITYFIFTKDESFELKAIPQGTRLIHNEYFSGMITPFLKNEVIKKSEFELNLINRSLKNFLEDKSIAN